ncbi:Na+/H+ antiporter NhaC [Salmonella enterica subsp. enterica]|nr:Na+/H+ antiporter NhaC [Salmonella enterica subsp. enterica]
MNQVIKKKEVTFFWAITPIIIMMVCICTGYFLYGIRAEPLILIGTASAAIIAKFHGCTWNDTFKSICDKISEALPVILIVPSIGFLIGAWMISGTIPMMIYYGLKWINPEYFYISAFFLGAIVSVCTGTSWGSMGTVGIAMVGVAIGQHLSLPVTAGAIISGSWFGDKLSPVSDSTNIAVLSVGANLYSHIAHLLWTTIPGFIVCCVVYTFVGKSLNVSSVIEPESVIALISSLDKSYHFNILLLLPPVVVLYGSISKKPPIPTLFLSALVSIILALTFQSFSLASIGDSVVGGFKLNMLPKSVDINSLSPDLYRLLERGGAVSMFSTFVTIFSAFSFAGAMSATGSLRIVITALTKGITSTLMLVATTIITGITICGCTANGTLPLLLAGDAFKDEYKKRGLASVNLSRTLEDAGTVVEPIIPWTASGVYCAAITGVLTIDYLPWAILCYTGMCFALLWAATGIGIARISQDTPQKTSEIA